MPGAPMGGGRVQFVGTGGALIVMYILHVLLPIMGVAIIGFGIPSALMGLAKGEAWGTIIALPFLLLGMVGYIGAILYATNKLLGFYWENMVIEGKRCQFYGTPMDLVKEMGVQYLILLVTGGLYAPWFICKMKKFVYSKTDVSGERLEFNGDPSALVGPYFIGIILCICTFYIYMPWFLNTIYEFDWSNTSISGRRFGFQKDPGGLFGTWILVAILNSCTGGIYAPWGMCKIWEWETQHIQ